MINNYITGENSRKAKLKVRKRFVITEEKPIPTHI